MAKYPDQDNATTVSNLSCGTEYVSRTSTWVAESREDVVTWNNPIVFYSPSHIHAPFPTAGIYAQCGLMSTVANPILYNFSSYTFVSADVV